MKNRDEFENHYAKSKKPDIKCTLYDSIFVKFWKGMSNSDSKSISGARARQVLTGKEHKVTFYT